jgi:hypothetical protein
MSTEISLKIRSRKEERLNLKLIKSYLINFLQEVNTIKNKLSKTALSNQNVPDATFATFVASEPLLSPQLRGMCFKRCNLFCLSTKKRDLEKLPVVTLKWPVATCGEWRQGWTTLV